MADGRDLGVLEADALGDLSGIARVQQPLDEVVEIDILISPIATPDDASSLLDPARARELLSKAAETNAEAQYQLGMMLAEGTGGTKDDTAARALFEKAAVQNHPGALERMGAFAQSGRGGAKDRTPPRPITSAPRRSAMKMPKRRWNGCGVP